MNSANKYLLESIRELEIQEPEILINCPHDIEVHLRASLDNMKQATDRLLSFPYHCNSPIPIAFFGGPIDSNSVEYRHLRSLVIVDDMVQDVAAGCVTRPRMDIISSRCDTKPYGKTISEVQAAMLCGY